MDIHVVKPGDTLYSIALSHGVPMSRLLEDNQLPDPSRLVVGQTIVIQYPERTYVVRSGDTLFSIAQANGLTVKTLLRNNPSLAGEDRIFPGQELVLAYRQEKQGTLTVNGYAYPHIDRALLQRTGGEIMAVEPLAGEGHKNAAGFYLAAVGGDQCHLRVTGQFSGRHQPCQKLACMDLFHCSIPSRSIECCTLIRHCLAAVLYAESLGRGCRKSCFTHRSG